VQATSDIRVFMLERAANARAAAAAKGKLPGRPPKLTTAKLATARAAIAAGQSVDDVAPTIGISRATLYRHLAADARTSAAPRVPLRVQVTGSRFNPTVPTGARYVGRPAPGLKGSPYANTHRVGLCKRCATEHDQAEAVIAYTRDLANDPDLIARARAELAGQDLACWCPPTGEDITCHGDVLVRVVAVAGPRRPARHADLRTAGMSGTATDIEMAESLTTRCGPSAIAQAARTRPRTGRSTYA
jgi:hypothetical protein